MLFNKNDNSEISFSRLRCFGSTWPNDRPPQHFHRHPLLDGTRSNRLRRKSRCNLRQSKRSMVPRYHSIRNGRIAATPVRTAPNAGPVFNSAQPSAPIEEQKVEQEVPRLHRNSISQRLSRTSVHGTAAEARVHQGPTDRTASEDTAEGSYR